MDASQQWSADVLELWSVFDDIDRVEFVARMTRLVDERPDGDAVALLELASAYDSSGDENRAATLYEQAFAAGLPDGRRREATIQYASTLRNVGRPADGARLLQAERDRSPDPAGLDDELAAFHALCLHSAGRAGDAVRMLLDALVPHLGRYQTSLTNYAHALDR